MSSRILWLLLIFALGILGFIIYVAYFLEEKPTSTELPSEESSPSPTDTFPELEQIIVPPPDYGGENSGLEETVPAPASVTETERLKIVTYRGVLTKVGRDSVSFKPISPQEGEEITAHLDSETQITQVFLTDKAVRETIKLSDLQVDDEIIIGGMARDYGEPILDTIHIERFYLK